MAGLGPIGRCPGNTKAIVRSVVDGLVAGIGKAIRRCLGCTPGADCFVQARLCATGGASGYWLACDDAESVIGGAFFPRADPGLCLYVDPGDGPVTAVPGGGILLAAGDIVSLESCDVCRCCNPEVDFGPHAHYLTVDLGTPCPCVFLIHNTDTFPYTEARNAKLTTGSIDALKTVRLPVPGFGALFGDVLAFDFYDAEDCSGDVSGGDIQNLQVSGVNSSGVDSSKVGSIAMAQTKGNSGADELFAWDDSDAPGGGPPISCPFTLNDVNGPRVGCPDARGIVSTNGTLNATPVCTLIAIDFTEWGAAFDGVPRMVVDNTAQTISIPFTATGAKKDWFSTKVHHPDPFNVDDFYAATTVWGGGATPQAAGYVAHFSTGAYPWATVSPGSGIGDGTLTLGIGANGTGADRAMRACILDVVFEIYQDA